MISDEIQDFIDKEVIKKVGKLRRDIALVTSLCDEHSSAAVRNGDDVKTKMPPIAEAEAFVAIFKSRTKASEAEIVYGIMGDKPTATLHIKAHYTSIDVRFNLTSYPAECMQFVRTNGIDNEIINFYRKAKSQLDVLSNAITYSNIRNIGIVAALSYNPTDTSLSVFEYIETQINNHIQREITESMRDMDVILEKTDEIPAIARASAERIVDARMAPESATGESEDQNVLQTPSQRTL